MILELIFLTLIIVAFGLFYYKSAVHEFQILQKTYDEHIPWHELLQEDLPIVVRALPKHLLSSWSQKYANKTWPITVLEAQTQKRFRTTLQNWYQEQDATIPTDLQIYTDTLRLSDVTSMWQAIGFRRWSMVTSKATPGIQRTLMPSTLTPVAAEGVLLTATDGEPLMIWIAHEGAIPAISKPYLVGADPWLSTSDTVPLITEVKYVEMRLRPGNAVYIPRHWYYAIKCESNQSQESQNHASWYTKIAFHSPISYLVSAVQKSES